MKIKSIEKWWYWGILIVASIFLCFFKISDKSLSLDEVSTVNFSRNLDYLKHVIWVDEGNMWLYYFLMHWWLKLGDSELIVRGLSALFGIGSVIAFYFFARELKGERIAKSATPLFLTNLYF